MITIAILLSIPLRSGGTGSATTAGFSIVLKSGGSTITTGHARPPVTAALVSGPDSSAEVPGGIGNPDLPSKPPDIGKEAPSDHAETEQAVTQALGKDILQPAWTPEETVQNQAVETKGDKLQVAAKEKLGGSGKKEPEATKEKSDLESSTESSVKQQTAPDTGSGQREMTIARRQPLPLSNKKALPSFIINRPPSASHDQEPVGEAKAPPTPPQPKKQDISLMAIQPSRTLQNEANPGIRKEKSPDKIAASLPPTPDNNTVQKKDGQASPLTSLKKQSESTPHAATGGEIPPSRAEQKTTVVSPAHETLPQTPAPIPVKTPAPDMQDAHDQNVSQETKAEPTVLPKSTPIVLTPSHETSLKSDANQDVDRADSSLKSQPDHKETTKVITSGHEDPQGKTSPLAAAPEAATKTASVPHPVTAAKTASASKSPISSVHATQQSGADSKPNKEREQDINRADPSLKSQPDHRETAKVITPGHEDPQGKTSPLAAAPEAATVTASVPDPVTAAVAKPPTSLSPQDQRSDADTVSEKGKKVIPNSGAASVSSELPGEPKISNRDREDSPANSSNHHVSGPSPERRGKAALIESSDKKTPGKAAPSETTTPEMLVRTPLSDKQMPVPSLPAAGNSRAAAVAAMPPAPIPDPAQAGKDQQNAAAPAKGDDKQNETKERQGIPLPEVLVSKDIQVEILLKGSGIPSVFTRFTRRPYPVSSRREPPKKEEEVLYTSSTRVRELDDSGIRFILSVASAEKGVYSFAVENKEKDTHEAVILFHLYEGREKARTKEYRNIALRAGASYVFKFVLPDAVFWDDDVFSAEIEDSRYITKVQDASGLVWKEEKEPAMTGISETPISQPLPAPLRSP